MDGVAFYSSGVWLVRRVRCVGSHAMVHLVLKNDVQGVDDAGDVCERDLSACCPEEECGEGGKDLQPRTVNSRLMRRSAPQPRSRKTPRGGSTTAQMILMMSLLGRVSFVLLVCCSVATGGIRVVHCGGGCWIGRLTIR
jgi:hypothetical protein